MDDPIFWTNSWVIGPLCLLFSIWGYLYLQKCRQNEVRYSSSFASPFAPTCTHYTVQMDKLFGQQYGCLPIEKILPYKWPLAIDVFKSQYDALRSGNLLAYQADYFKEAQLGHTFQVKLLGRIGYFTMNPRNLEYMIQRNYDSKTPTQNYHKISRI